MKHDEIILNTHKKEQGQSIVLIALAFVGLLAFVGIAVDAGVIYARNTQLQSAVDAAALAGVTEMAGQTTTARADELATQFLLANNVPLSAITSTMQTNANQTDLQSTEYAVTVTWPVELFFLKVIGRDSIDLTKSATAAFFPLADIYASRRVEDGALTTSNQSVFGPSICTGYGDPFSPFNSPFRPDGSPGTYTYRYRILLPQSYPDSELRVELFDPDSINNADNTAIVNHSAVAIGQGDPAQETGTCSSNDQKNPCLIDTGEGDYIGSNGITLDSVNLFWFMRIDENRGAGGAPGNGGCGVPSSYSPGHNTQTVYELYYYAQFADGSIQRVDLASYTGQVGDGNRDTGDHGTDMHWVSPGAPTSYGPDRYDDVVPADPGSRTTNGFQLDIANDLNGILEDAGNGNRYVFLDVTAISGASENGFEVWAGPPTYVDTVPSEVNARNIRVLNTPGSHTSRGATVFAIGNLPMNSNFGNRIDVPLIYVGPENAGANIFISLFDTDSGAAPPINFFFDSISRDDWEQTFAVNGQADPDGVADGVRCKPGSCNNQWVTPAYQITVPGDTTLCDWANPDENCIPFYGGRLTASYDGGGGDTYGWQVTMAGQPYLVR